MVIYFSTSTRPLCRFWEHLSAHRGWKDLLHCLCVARDTSVRLSAGWCGRSARHHIQQRHWQSGENVCGESVVTSSHRNVCCLSLSDILSHLHLNTVDNLLTHTISFGSYQYFYIFVTRTLTLNLNQSMCHGLNLILVALMQK